MAYVALGSTFSSDTSATEVLCILPGHQEDDLLVVAVTQDGGTGAFTLPGAPWTTLYNASGGGARVAVLWAVAGSTPLEDFTVTSTISEGFNGTVSVIREADVSNPIHASNSKTGSTGLTVELVTPTLTTTIDDTLLLAIFAGDQRQYFRTKISDLNVHARIALQDVATLVGSRPMPAAGSAPSIGAFGFYSDTVHCVYLAVKSSVAGVVAPHCTANIDLLYDGTAPSFVGLTGIASTINGLTVYDHTSTLYPVITVVDDWSPALSISCGTWPADGFCGGYVSFAEKDLSDKIYFMRFQWITATTLVGTEGWIVVVIDYLGNWAAYQLKRRKEAVFEAVETFVIDIARTEPIDGSVTPVDLTRVTGFGYAHHRLNLTNSTSRAISFYQSLIIKDLTLTGGWLSSPATPKDVAVAMFGNGYLNASSLQGDTQFLSKLPLQLGNGSIKSHIKFSRSAFEVASVKPGTSTPALSCPIKIKASANDVMDFSSSLLSTPTKQLFEIDSASSPSADYLFRSMVISGYEPRFISGVSVVGAQFVGCYQITTNGCALTECAIEDSLDAAAVTTNNPANIANCAFTSGGTGHAIEITTPGTYTFTGNRFTGYGTAGTTDAAIYNNSGGAVTLNITGGGDTPTVKNAGANTTTINNNVSVTLEDVVVGSSIRIEKLSDGSLVEFRIADASTEVFGVGGSVAYKIKVRKASATPFYRPWSTTTTPTADMSITVSQELDE